MPETTADFFSPQAFEQACDRSGLTRKRIAEALGVTPTTMSNVTSGRTTPSLKLLSRMVEIFGGELSDYLAMPAPDQWKLAHFRVSRGLTQGELAKCIGTSQRIVSNWEVGKYAPSGESLTKLADLYGVPESRIKEISAATAATATQDRERAASSAAILKLAADVVLDAEEAVELAWQDGRSEQEREVLYTQVRGRAEQALAIVGALIPQLTPARRVGANRLVKRLEEVLEETSDI